MLTLERNVKVPFQLGVKPTEYLLITNKNEDLCLTLDFFHLFCNPHYMLLVFLLSEPIHHKIHHF